MSKYLTSFKLEVIRCMEAGGVIMCGCFTQYQSREQYNNASTITAQRVLMDEESLRMTSVPRGQR
jgi:hypothetical protein